MPDAHLGYAAPIGAVLVTKGFVVPAWVGYDIGCGLIALRISTTKKIDLVKLVKSKAKQIHNQVQRDVPMGLGRTNQKTNPLSEKTQSEFQKIIEQFEKGEYDKQILTFIKDAAPKHLGTLGSGNHFIELGSPKDKKELWIIIHSGSRGIGHRIAQKYMKKAANSEKSFEKTFPLSVDSKLGKEYINILDFSLKYALLNRLEMASRVSKALQFVLKIPIKSQLWTNKTHNHAVLERGKYIHRKGATPAKKGERGVIPGNMRDGSFLVEGKGSSKFLHSSSHGAGRALSRSQAKKEITLSDFQKQMEGIESDASSKTLDEAPEAYKKIEEVMQAQKASVKPIKHIFPLINWKG